MLSKRDKVKRKKKLTEHTENEFLKISVNRRAKALTIYAFF